MGVSGPGSFALAVGGAAGLVATRTSHRAARAISVRLRPSPSSGPRRRSSSSSSPRHQRSRQNSTRPQRLRGSVTTCAALEAAGTMAQSSLLGAFLLDMGIQMTEKFYDLFGSLAFLGVVWQTLLTGASTIPRHLLLTAMVTLWAIRLGSFLVMRVLATGGDSRFDKAKKSAPTFFVYWTLQGVWVFVTLLPTLLALTSSTQAAGWVWSDFAGFGIWALGIIIETTADLQKFRFKMDSKNDGRYITSGLWSVSRHPNYFGEMVCWWGVFLAACASLSGTSLAIAAGSPAFVMFLLLKVSGVPLLEKNADKRWGSEADYQDYKRRTNCVVPLPGFNFL